jgi:hypothetical protein
MESGKRIWAIPAGNIPVESHGHEPEFVSHDRISVLNMNEQDAKLEITIYYEDQEPVGPYPLKVQGQRVRKVRFNDLINPQAIPLGKNYSAVIKSDQPIVVQFTRQDTSTDNRAITGTISFAN